MWRGLERPPRWAVIVIVLGLCCLGVGGALAQSRPAPPGFTPPASAGDPTPDPLAMPVVAASLQVDFATAPAKPAQAGGEGHTLGVINTRSSAGPLAVKNGLLIHGNPIGKNSAAYLEAEMPQPVQVVGGEAVFSAKDSGSIALIAWQSSQAAAGNASPPQPPPNAGIHFVAFPTGWHLGIFNTSTQTEDQIASGKFATPLATDGATRHRFEVAHQGDRAWVTLPDGSTRGPYADPRIADWSGPWACWELYESDVGLTPAAFAKVWAG